LGGKGHSDSRSQALKSPHILLAANNCKKVRTNLAQILDAKAIKAIDDEITRNVAGLFEFGLAHYTFAMSLAETEWRQCVSRLYYAAYNMGRSIRLFKDGHFSTEISDHRKVDDFPQDFPNRSRYANQLVILREDRNLCDYDHTATETDLVISRIDALVLVDQLANDARTYLAHYGVKL
jgi:hypothetical protein